MKERLRLRIALSKVKAEEALSTATARSTLMCIGAHYKSESHGDLDLLAAIKLYRTV